MTITLEMVLHTRYGGFSLTDEIINHLRARKSPLVDSFQRIGGSWLSDSDDDGLRRDPDLVEVVRELMDELDGASKGWVADPERRHLCKELEQRLLNGLRVVEVEIEVEIYDDDGKEHIVVSGSERRP